METFTGQLRKMKTSLGDPVDYFLRLDRLEIPLNPLLGREIVLEHRGAIHCLGCGKKIKKSYQQGYCFPCTQTLAQCDLCILKPELCHYHKGTCRQPEWGLAHCMHRHYVYLANSSGLKVGITRGENIPTRWIDQGAIQALPILKVSSRFHSGLLEVLFKDHVADRTNWRLMLSGRAEAVDLRARRDALFETCAAGLRQLEQDLGDDSIEYLEGEEPLELRYPVLEYPQKVSSLNLDKNPRIQARLMGIKGQYLLLSTGVINMRKYSGYEVALSI